jgi:hypothetical protein
VWVPPVEEAPKLPTTIQVIWSDQPSIAPPRAGVCSCISVSRPPRQAAGGIPVVGSAPEVDDQPYLPFPAGSTQTLENKCSKDVDVFIRSDTVVRSLAIPASTSANGRRFAYVPNLKPGQKLFADLAGEIGGFTAIHGCPNSVFKADPFQQVEAMCLSSNRILPSLPPGPPLFCNAQGKPGSDCVCRDANGKLQPGINWKGPPVL